MSTHGFQLSFAVEESGRRHVVTAHYEVFYEQTSEQTLPEAMSAVRLVINQIGRDFPWLRSGTIASDKCNTLQAFGQMLFIRQGNMGGWTTASHSPVQIHIAVWSHSEAGNGKDQLDAHFGWLELSWCTCLRFNGGIVSPRDLFDAAVEYPVANTSFILADTSHPDFGAKFNIPKLAVRPVHEYVYGCDGNFELYHHTGLKRRGIYEKLWFSPHPHWLAGLNTRLKWNTPKP
jgi:hypothetical protein